MVLLNHTVFSFWVFFLNTTAFSLKLRHFTFTPMVHENSRISSPGYFLFLPFMEGILMDVKWYFTMLFICIFLMINNIQYLFIYLSTTCMSSLKKCLFMYIFVPTLIQTFLVLILLNYMSFFFTYSACNHLPDCDV